MDSSTIASQPNGRALDGAACAATHAGRHALASVRGHGERGWHGRRAGRAECTPCLAPWSESRQKAATEEHNILHTFTSLFSPAEDGAELELGTATRCGIENAGASAYRANLPPQGGGASDARRWAFSVSPVKEVIVCVIGLFIMRMGPGSLPAAALPQALGIDSFSLCAAARNRVGRVTTFDRYWNPSRGFFKGAAESTPRAVGRQSCAAVGAPAVPGLPPRLAEQLLPWFRNFPAPK